MPLILLAAALAPALLLVAWFYRVDVFREPRGVMFKTFLLGVGSAFLAAIVAMPAHGFVETVADPLAHGLFAAFLLAAIPEEIAKFLVLKNYCSRHTAFDEPMDGVVYGATASLGFAAIENVFYVATGGWPVALMRAMTSVPAHAMMGAIMGFHFSRAYFAPAQRNLHYAMALLTPILVHGLYDFPIMASVAGYDGPAALVLPWLTLLVLVGGLVTARRMALDLQLRQAAYVVATVGGTAPGVASEPPDAPVGNDRIDIRPPRR